VNEYISKRLRRILNGKEVFTITNNYNQVFDNPQLWDTSIKLPYFDGLTLLTITASYPHKNLEIALKTLDELHNLEFEKNVRFVFTIKQNQFPNIPDRYKENFVFLGPVTINQCPPIYTQVDIMFQPSLLECFSATYVEAMKMGTPIITTDLGFAHSLCGDAALYYSALDPKDLAQQIIRLGRDKKLADKLINLGKSQLEKFASAQTRFNKLISILDHHN
ncbi:MAG: glycosyltransferase, partial [Muribaculaceae bacterium]|nr:glycosyltransferase [Muribaculaceae bacterium]